MLTENASHEDTDISELSLPWDGLQNELEHCLQFGVTSLLWRKLFCLFSLNVGWVIWIHFHLII